MKIISLVSLSLMIFASEVAMQQQEKKKGVLPCAPQIILKSIKNKTVRNLLLKTNDEEFTIDDLPKQIVLNSVSNGGVVSLIDKRDPYFMMALTVQRSDNEVKAQFLVYDIHGILDPSKPDYKRRIDANKAIRKQDRVFSIELELEGNHLEKSKIKLNSEPPSLLDLSIESLIKDIKNGKIKLDEAKKKLPLELQEKLNDKLNIK